MLLLASSFTFGMAMLGMQGARPGRVNTAGPYLRARRGLHRHGGLRVRRADPPGAGPQTSAFLSAYFGTVGTHGLHVSVGLLWLLVMMHHVRRFGLGRADAPPPACLSLFWHFTDLIWICVFTFVYLREFV